MATYVIDKRTGNDANNGISIAQAWKTIRKANSPGLPSGTHTVEIVEGSGPYDVTDLGNISQNAFYPQQAAGSLITWNFNGNRLGTDIDVNDGTRKWARSAASGKENWFYLTSADGTKPKAIAWDFSVIDLPETETCTIGGNWSCKSTNLNNPPYIIPGQGFILYGRYLTNNWCWGNFDGLAFNTLYVLVDSGIDPTGTGISVMVNGLSVSTLLTGGYASSVHVFNDAVFSGARMSILSPTYGAELNRCVLENVGWQGINAVTTSLLQKYTARHTKFINCGHAGIYCERQHNIDVYHCHFENVHTAAKFASDTAYTFNYFNNTTKNLLAGVIQKDVATPTFNEDYNQHHIDPNTTHGGPAIAFTTGTRQWTTTGAHDFPASVATTGMGVDLVNTGGALPNGLSRLAHAAVIVTGINDGVQEDINGNVVGDYPNIGADQYDYAPGFGPWTAFDATMPALALSPSAPGKLRSVQTWTRDDVTKQDIEKVMK